MGHGIEMEVCQGTGSGVGVRKTQETMAHKVRRGAQRCVEGCAGGHGAWVGARLARVGAHVCAKVGMVEIGCGGYLGGTPPIGKLEPLGLISGEKVLQDGWQGWTDTSKCRNAAGFGMHTRT